jgi:hypothetical protein
MEESRMKKHVTVVGALQIGFSALWLIGAIFLFFVLNFARDVVGEDDIAKRILGLISTVLPLFEGLPCLCIKAGHVFLSLLFQPLVVLIFQSEPLSVSIQSGY